MLLAAGSREAKVGIQALNDAVVCALALSGYVGAGLATTLFRAAAAVLAGRALAAVLSHPQGTRWGRVRRPAISMVLLWTASFAPVGLVGSPDLVRSGAASAVLVLLVGSLPPRTTLALSVAVALTALLFAGVPPHAGAVGVLEFTLGAAWPRTWSHVAVTAGLFLLGGAWGAGSVRAGASPSVT